MIKMAVEFDGSIEGITYQDLIMTVPEMILKLKAGVCAPLGLKRLLLCMNTDESLQLLLNEVSIGHDNRTIAIDVMADLLFTMLEMAAFNDNDDPFSVLPKFSLVLTLPKGLIAEIDDIEGNTKSVLWDFKNRA